MSVAESELRANYARYLASLEPCETAMSWEDWLAWFVATFNVEVTP
jgi:hypothetical protein